MYNSVGSHQFDRNNSQTKFIGYDIDKLIDWILEFFCKIIIIITLLLTLAKISSLKHQQQLLVNAISKIKVQKQTRDINTWDQLIKASSLQYPKQVQQIQVTKQRRKQGIDKNIQLGSQLDYLKINQSRHFQIFKQNYLRLAPHEVLQFSYNESLQKPLPKLELYRYFQSQQQIEDFLIQNSKTHFYLPFNKDIQAHLASVLRWNFTQKKYLQAEYYLMNKKYKIGQIKNQLPICVISTGYNIFTKDKYKLYLQSIQRQNYSNYQVVLVDDFSPDGSAKRYYQYLQKTDYRLKNRLKIVHTLQNLGALANMYIWVQKYCSPNSVVINIDADDSLIGAQAFNVINANYQDPNIWYVYTRYLQQQTPQSIINFIASQNLYIPVQRYRINSLWVTSHMRTYRQKLMAKSPLQHYIQYRYNETSQKIEPTFHLSSADRFQIYNHLELSGDNRVKFIPQMLYYYQIAPVSKIRCYRQFQIYQQLKSKAKTPLSPMPHLDANLQLNYSVPLDNFVYFGLINSYFNYISCMSPRNYQIQTTPKTAT